MLQQKYINCNKGSQAAILEVYSNHYTQKMKVKGKNKEMPHVEYKRSTRTHKVEKKKEGH